PVPGLRLDGARLRLPADARLDGSLLTLRPRPGARLGAAAFRWRDSIRGDAIELPLDADAGPLLEGSLRGDRLAHGRYRLALLPAPFAIRVLRADGAPLELRGTTPRLDLDLHDWATGRVLLADARVEVPAYRLEIAEAGGELQLAGGGLAAGAAVPVRAGSVRHTGDPAWFRPLSLRGVLRPEGARLGFRIEAAGAGDEFKIDLDGRHDLASGSGRAEVRMAPLEFAPGGLQPAQLAPLLATTLTDVGGWVDLDGTLAWGPNRPRSDLALLVHDLSLSAGPARLERINGAIQFDSLAPPSTPPNQLLAVALLDVGLPLLDGVIDFRLERDGAVAVEQARWRWAGGEVGTGAFAYRPGEPLSLSLQARSLDVAQLLDQVQLGGLEGTGRLSGALPVRIEDGVAIIAHGELKAHGPGWLRYRPQEPPAALQAGGEGVNLMLQALENFRYEALRITLDGRTDSEMQVGLHLSGANPQLYGGYPVEFNLNLEGELGAVLQAGIQGYSLPERIAERMQRLRR
ncbi:MAG TPA: YdbH domain-containing protein, partial [Geminicoccaceae bacterium]|nr:YdbH domain-containing protein [Geminicoccaceae bacterium]